MQPALPHSGKRPRTTARLGVGVIGTLLGAGLLAGCSATSSSAGGENAAHGGEAALALPVLTEQTDHFH